MVTAAPAPAPYHVLVALAGLFAASWPFSWRAACANLTARQYTAQLAASGGSKARFFAETASATAPWRLTSTRHAQAERSPPLVREPLRVAFLGGAQAGKSTLLAGLATGQRDNGQGSARTLVMRHPHELESGTTSPIS